MNFKTEYQKLLNEQYELNDFKNELNLKQEALNKESNKIILSRIRRLQAVGESVVRKSFSGDELFNKWYKSSYYGQNFQWLFTHIYSDCEVTQSCIYIGVDYNSRKRIRIEKELLSISDRDFAKKVRKNIKQFKNEIKVFKAGNAQENLRKAQLELEKLEEKIRELKNLAEKSNAKMKKVNS